MSCNKAREDLRDRRRIVIGCDLCVTRHRRSRQRIRQQHVTSFHRVSCEQQSIIARLLLAEQMQHDFAAMSTSPMLDQINALPCSERRFVVHYRN